MLLVGLLILLTLKLKLNSSAVADDVHFSSNFILVKSKERVLWAEKYCVDNFGTGLAAIHTVDDYLEASRLILANGGHAGVWTGGRAVKYEWSDGTALSIPTILPGPSLQDPFQLWDPEFQGICVYIWVGALWLADECWKLKPFLCSKPTPRFTVLPMANKSWTDARDYCRKTHGTDLATIGGGVQNLLLQMQMMNDSLESAWIGLTDTDSGGEGHWLWTDKDSSAYRNWQSGQPSNGVGEDFAVMRSSDGTWKATTNDSPVMAFVCNSLPDITVVSVKTPGKTWEEANHYCAETYGTELATILDEYYDAYVYKRMQALSINTAWIGASDSATDGQWLWADGSSMTYTNWCANCPTLRQPNTNDCAIVSAPNAGKWLDEDCETTQRGFVCNKP